MRRLLRIILWMVKGVLLLIALAALILWPTSRGRNMGVSAERDTAGPAAGEFRRYFAACSDGWAIMTHDWWLTEFHQEVASGDEGWRWDRWSTAYTWGAEDWPGRWGPLRWDFDDGKHSDPALHSLQVAAPLWLVAFAAGTWPLASIAFALRRRIKLRRAAREGLCNHCGYDLRATPAAGGALLPVCPECGKETPAGNKPSPPPS